MRQRRDCLCASVDRDRAAGTKFVLLTSLGEYQTDNMLHKVYEIYADTVVKSPFHSPEMPIRVEGFDIRINALFSQSSGQ